MTRRRQIATAVAAILVIAAVATYVVYRPGTPAPRAAGPGFGPGFGPGGPGATRGGDSGPIPVLATPARNADVPVYLDGVGTAKALNTVIVRPQVDGKLISVAYTEGQDVERGYVLARIDPVTYQAQLDQAIAKKAQDEALLANAKLDLDRFTRLAATNAATKQQADTQRYLVAQDTAQVASDQAAVDNARAIVGYTDIVAPIAGRTGIRQVDEGNLVHATDATGIVVITQLRPISVFFNLPQQQIPQITKGMAAGALPVQAVPSDGGSTLDQGKLVVIDNQVDQTTGTVRLKAEFPNANLQLWPGQFINVRVLIDTLHQVVVVPTAAVQRGPDGTFVYVLRDNDTVAQRPVTTTQQNDVQSVIASGLQAGDRVVTNGFTRLTDGAKVRVTTTDDSGKAPAAATAPNPRPGGANRRRPQPGSEASGTGAGTPAGTAATPPPAPAVPGAAANPAPGAAPTGAP